MSNLTESNSANSPEEHLRIDQKVEGNGNQVIGVVQNSTVVYVSAGGTVNLPAPPSNELDTSKKTPNNLPRSGVVEFVGREQKLIELHNRLQQVDRLVVTSVRGMGGVGKTELALQYAITSLGSSTYPGGVCWLRARGQEIATQIVSFARANLGMKPPEDMEAQEQVAFTWQRWPEGDTLIVIDDVKDYEAITLYLPPSDPRFKVLITTRQDFGASVSSINIEELSDGDAITLLKSIVGDDRIEAQHIDAEALCQWVGNLPLGLELLGRFLAGKPDWTIAKLLERLESKRLAAKALIASESGMTATLGVAAALELSWAELSKPEQDLACLLGMFAVAPIPWNLVEQCFPEVDPDELEEMQDEGLHDRSLLKRVGEGTYQLHQVVQEFFREKLATKGDTTLQSAFCSVIVAQAKSLDETPTLKQIERMRGVIPHLEETADEWLEFLSEEDLIAPFEGIRKFYVYQGKYGLAEPWCIKCLEVFRRLLGNDHPNVAISLDHLALLYTHQGQYEEAEPLHLEALALLKKLFGNDHPDVATSLDNLATLYDDQGRYEEAESLHLEVLALRKNLFGNDHPDVATSLDHLADLYNNLGRYKEAEPLFLEALALRKKLLGNDHPDVAISLNNLASFYSNQGRYEAAEPLLNEAVALLKKLFGNDHPDVATSLNNLAFLYDNQERYEAAEPLYIEVLVLRRKLLGNDHPDVAISLNNLAYFYCDHGRYEEAELLHVEALAIFKELLGNDHPAVAASLNGLALLYCNQGRYEEAELLHLEALALRKKLLGNDHPHVANSYFNLGILYDQQGQYPKAKALYLHALPIREQCLGSSHPDTQKLLSKLNDLPEGTEALPFEELGLP